MKQLTGSTIARIGNTLVLKETNNFGDLTLKYVDTTSEDYSDYTTETFSEGNWPSLDLESLKQRLVVVGV